METNLLNQASNGQIVSLFFRSILLCDAVHLLIEKEGYCVKTRSGTDKSVDNVGSLADDTSMVLCDVAFCVKQPQILEELRQKTSARIVILADPTEYPALTADLIYRVDAILTTGMSSDTLLRSLEGVRLGERIIPVDLMRALMAETVEPVTVNGIEYSKRRSPSPREAEILRHLVQGDSNKLIARKLGIAEATVKVHLKGLSRKIGSANRTQTAIWAQSKGY